jgi:hypothetical protein
MLWMVGGPAAAFGIGACVAAVAALMLLLRRLPKQARAPY